MLRLLPRVLRTWLFGNTTASYHVRYVVSQDCVSNIYKSDDLISVCTTACKCVPVPVLVPRRLLDYRQVVGSRC